MKFNPMLMDYMATWTCCSCFESKVGRISPTVEEGKVDDAKVEDVETTVDTNPPTAKNEVAFASLPEEPEKKTKFRKSQSLDVTRLRRCECRCCCCCCCCRRNDAKMRNTNDGGTNESGDDTMLCEDCSRAEQFETSYKELGDGVTLECGRPGESPRWSASCQSKNESPPPPYTENEGNFEGGPPVQRIDAKYCMVRNTGQPHRCRFIRHIRSCSCGPLTSGEDFSSIATEGKEVGTFMEHPGEIELMSGRPDTSEVKAEATPTPIDA
uniref:Uncharacterized protein n=1 Tax=Ciona savignyi TaxID=51511 RepID=H2YKL3_CIOSA